MPHLGVEVAVMQAGRVLLPIFMGQRQQILDALHGLGGSVVRSQYAPWPFEQGITRRELYAMRDQSGLSRQQFYMRHFEQPETNNWKLDVDGTRAEGDS